MQKLWKNFRNKNTQGSITLSGFIIILIVALFLECFLFNYQYFKTRNYEPLEIKPLISDSTVEKVEDSEYCYEFSDNKSGLYFSEFNIPIKNIYLDVENTEVFPENNEDKVKEYTSKIKNAKNDSIYVKYFVTDESNYYGLSTNEVHISPSIENTKYTTLHLAGSTNYLKIIFTNAAGNTLNIKHVILNANVPFNFSVIRFLAVLAIMLFIYVFRPHSKIYEIKINLKKKSQIAIIAVFILMNIFGPIKLAYLNTGLAYTINENVDVLNFDYQRRYILLTDALLHCHFDVDYLAPGATSIEDIEEIENPYDPGLLISKDMHWSDYAYYEGKYYVYFGIVPALIFNIPMKLLFNIEVMALPCVIMLIPFFILFSCLFIYKLLKRYSGDKDLSLPLYLMFCILFIWGSGLALTLVQADSYYLPIFSGLTFAIAGLYFWLSAKEENRKLSIGKLIAGSLCIALTAGCRPQFLISMFFAIPIFGDDIFKDRKLFSKESIKQTLSFVLPFIIFGSFICYYNYARFGSIFDFGANYNQTNNDMTTRGYEIVRAFQGLFYYILQPLNISGRFPFILSTTFDTAYMGTNISLNPFGGILFLQPITFFIFLFYKMRKELKNNKSITIISMFISFMIIITMLDSMMAGIVPRYYLDYSYLGISAAILIICAMINKYHDTDGEILIRGILVALVIYCLIVAILIIFANKDNCPLQLNAPAVYNGLESLITFWK